MTDEQKKIWDALLELTSLMDNEQICQFFTNVCGTKILDENMKRELEAHGFEFD